MGGRLPFDYAARNLGRSPLRTVLTTLGAAMVVFLVILMVGFVSSLRETLKGTGDPANAIVLGAGSEDFLEQSEIMATVPAVIASSVRGITKHHGTPLVSAEIHHATAVRMTGEKPAKRDQLRRGLIRGVTPMAFLLHRQVYLTQGRIPSAPGEVVVGKTAPTKLGLPSEAITIGSQVWFEGRDWTVVGLFEAPGTAYEAEIWAPLEELKAAARRETITCAIVRLDNPDKGMTALQIFTKTRLDLELNVVREVDYFARLSAFFRPVELLGWAMAGLVVLAGMFGGLNTMIAAIAGRIREIGCLETLGFGRPAVIWSLLQEAAVQVGAGALLASGMAVLLLRGISIRFTMGVVSLNVDGAALAAGIVGAVVLALVGTLVPALRLFRTPVTEMLRS